ncbi:LacI family DNA-binding transcriptional regulator [Streptomyces sp. NPDC056716]|uniref:LacI family DNA-binding transcriptional regulator n=1 Tax=unclassified Streptomyces TaxID=2593676 RepID=UPI0036C21897
MTDSSSGGAAADHENTAAPRRVTRRDVAREAGTSVAVVSYVLNDGPRPVAAPTRKRVLDAVEKTGYRPNILAQALSKGVTRTFGFVVPNIANPFIASVAHLIEKQLFAQGCVLLLGDSGDDREREAELVESFLERQVDGVIYMGVTQDLHLESLVRTRTPVVVFTHASSDGLAASVRIDERAAARAATEHLIEHGRTRLGVITGPETMLNAQIRLGGWQDAVEAAGLPVVSEWILHTPYTRRGGYQAGRRLLDADQLPDAVFAGNQEHALGLISALSERQVRVPDDLAVICLNGTPDAEYSVPSLSSVRQPIEAMAERALAVLSNPDAYRPDPITFDFELVPYRSCGCPHER